MNNNNSYNIYWIRHAESCANFLEYKITDQPNNEEALKDFIREINNTDGINLLNNSNTEKYEKYTHLMNQKYSELDKIIASENKSPENTNNCNKPYNKVILFKNKVQETCWERINQCKNKNDTSCLNNQKKNKAIYVKNSMYKSAWLLEPTLSSIGIIQSLNLGKRFNNMNNINIITSPYYYITSSMIRTVMTALLSMCMFPGKKSNIIYVVPYINEHTNWAYDAIKYDKQNMGNSSEELRGKMELVKLWIIENIDTFLKYSNTENQNKDNFIKNMNSIEIDYSILEHFEENDKENYNKDDLEKFKTEVLPLLFAKNKNSNKNSNEKKNIVAFSHGYLIKKIFTLFNKDKEKQDKIKSPDILFHTSISKESLNKNDDKNKTIDMEYLYINILIKRIRKKYSNIKNNKNNKKPYIDVVDHNVCSINSLYGIVNGISPQNISPQSISPQTGGKITYTKYRKIKKTIKKTIKNAKTKKTKKTNLKI